MKIEARYAVGLDSTVDKLMEHAGAHGRAEGEGQRKQLRYLLTLARQCIYANTWSAESRMTLLNEIDEALR